jgi:hypothetical protein
MEVDREAGSASEGYGTFLGRFVILIRKVPARSPASIMTTKRLARPFLVEVGVDDVDGRGPLRAMPFK